MVLRYKKVLITGRPGVGKSTLVQKVVDRLAPTAGMAGFLTVEIRAPGGRAGFELRGLNGRSRVLAHVDIDGPPRVGKYGVDTAGFEEFLQKMDLLNPGVDLAIIDEIGRMELFSDRFRKLVEEVMASDKEFLATISLKGGGFIREIKQRPETHLFEITPWNRDTLPEQILAQ